MGCCESKIIQADFVLYQEKNAEVRRGSFDDIEIYTEGDEIKRYNDTFPLIPSSFVNTHNSVELAFLMGTNASLKTSSVLIPSDGLFSL